MKRKNQLDQPVCYYGKVVFEFFNNEDEDFKRRALKSLCKETQKEFHLSCIPIEENYLQNPERGTIVFSFCAPHAAQGKISLDKIMAFLDQKAPARIISDEIEESEIT